MGSARRVPLAGEERKQILKIIRDGIARRPNVPETMSARKGVFTTRAEWFPLPEGEGKGEGTSELRLPAVDNLRTFQRCGSPRDGAPMIITNQVMLRVRYGMRPP